MKMLKKWGQQEKKIKIHTVDWSAFLGAAQGCKNWTGSQLVFNLDNVDAY